MEEGKSESLGKLTIGLLIATLFIVLFNSVQIGKLNGLEVTGAATTNAGSATQTVNLLANSKVIPKGVPNIYGKELGVSYDDVSASNIQKADATIKKLAVLDQQLTLTGKDLERYITIVSQISCEYCCGADSIIFPDGKAACGCAHSFAMRGLAKYLIKNHPTEFTNDQILEELGKWKTLFFPGPLTAKAGVLEGKGIELSYINLASNKYRGAEQGAPTSGAQSNNAQVGGC